MTIRWLRLDLTVAVCAAAVVLGSLLHIQSAHAEAFGEIGQVGEFGPGIGQFTYPTDLAVDPKNNDVYVLDEPKGERPGVGPESFRIQMFKPPLSPHETPAGHVEI